MKRFKFNYPVFVSLTLVAICLLTVIGAVFCVINAINYINADINGKAVLYFLLLIFNLAVFLLSLSLILCCYYAVESGGVVLRFGLIKIKTPFSEIDGFTLFSRSEKLVIYLKNGGYSVIVIDKRRYDEFFAEVKKFDGKLTYLTRTEEKEN